MICNCYGKAHEKNAGNCVYARLESAKVNNDYAEYFDLADWIRKYERELVGNVDH